MARVAGGGFLGPSPEVFLIPETASSAKRVCRRFFLRLIPFSFEKEDIGTPGIHFYLFALVKLGLPCETFAASVQERSPLLVTGQLH